MPCKRTLWIGVDGNSDVRSSDSYKHLTKKKKGTWTQVTHQFPSLLYHCLHMSWWETVIPGSEHYLDQQHFPEAVTLI